MMEPGVENKFRLLLRECWRRRASRLIGKRRWAEAMQKDGDGLTHFQHLAVRALEQAFGALRWQTIVDSEKYLRGLLPATESVIYVYGDGAQLQDGNTETRLERWDFKTPQALLTQLLRLASRVERGHVDNTKRTR